MCAPTVAHVPSCVGYVVCPLLLAVSRAMSNGVGTVHEVLDAASKDDFGRTDLRHRIWRVSVG